MLGLAVRINDAAWGLGVIVVAGVGSIGTSRGFLACRTRCTDSHTCTEADALLGVLAGVDSLVLDVRLLMRVWRVGAVLPVVRRLGVRLRGIVVRDGLHAGVLPLCLLGGAERRLCTQWRGSSGGLSGVRTTERRRLLLSC